MPLQSPAAQIKIGCAKWRGGICESGEGVMIVLDALLGAFDLGSLKHTHTQTNAHTDQDRECQMEGGYFI